MKDLKIIQRIKSIWPDYEVEEVLGQGGYGKVYKAKREHFNRTIYSAIKVIHIPPHPYLANELMSEGMDEKSVKDYFRRMAQDYLRENGALEDLKGAANIIIIEDSYMEQDEDGIGWTIYIRMEYLDSFEKLQQSYELKEDDIVTLGIDICNALIVCEQKNIVHRDIKPANIFINQFGTFKLGDFGASRKMEHTLTSMTQIGTAMYMAPELYRGDKADNRIDIYSLGIVLYRLANDGRFPLMNPAPSPIMPGEREEALLKRLKGEPLPLPSKVDHKLGEIIVKACSHKPEDRYQYAKELKQELEEWKLWKKYEKEILTKTEKTEENSSVIKSKKKKTKIKMLGSFIFAVVAIIVIIIFSTTNKVDNTNYNTVENTLQEPIEKASGKCGPYAEWILYDNGNLEILGKGEIDGEHWKEYSSEIKNVEIEDGITVLSDSIFYGCSNMTDIVLPESITEIGKSAFRECSSLEKIDLPSKITVIKSETFWGCSNLEDIVLPKGITELGERAFFKCKNLSAITIPKKVERINYAVFVNCEKLSSITLYGDAPQCDYYNAGFSSCASDLTFYVPKDAKGYEYGPWNDYYVAYGDQ